MQAANVEEAVALARRLQQEGKYNWFRGQVRDWTPSSSLERRLRANPAAKPQLDRQLQRFVGWVSSQPALRHLVEPGNEHALFAVLQHYGFPTCYVDFTTDPAVAGFFASDCKTPPETPGNSVIYCLDTKDLEALYDLVKKADDEWQAEAVVVDVSDLWRLQAQRGCFMRVNHAWYQVYDMDRIEFPWSGSPAFPARAQIYPEHKSTLEQLLDQYFFNEQMHEARAVVQDMLQQARANGHPIAQFRLQDQGKYRANAFSAPLQTLPTWHDEPLQSWRRMPAEHFDTAVRSRQLPLRMRDAASAPGAEQQVQEAITSALRWQPGLRQEAVEWLFEGLPEHVDTAHLTAAAREAWNGMRNLPYTDEDIAAAISALVPLAGLPGCRSFDGAAIARAFATWTPDAVEIELGTHDGSVSRAYCSEADLLAALDTDWRRMLLDAEASASTATAALRQTHDPRLMFDFARLTRVFARQAIPSQLAQARPLILFNPADLDTFGLP